MATTSVRMFRPASRLPLAVATAGIALVLFLVYVLFDLREGGARASLTTTEGGGQNLLRRGNLVRQATVLLNVFSSAVRNRVYAFAPAFSGPRK